ncbi:hypothetical protein [Halorussus ruber]|uniref:hypothetical protein n=1 Tax=Halorussus ruber TaxID=1126238 RepID=UPI001091BCEB|nr:hypothetical protein [Halorussus ruber]
MERWIPYIPPGWAVILDGVITAIAVGVSLYIQNPSQKLIRPVPIGVTLVVVAFLISSLVSYATQYQATMRVQEDTQRTILDIALEQLLSKYRDEIADCDLRANVMLVNHRWEFAIPPHRKRYLNFQETHGGYSEAELEQEYPSGAGCAGTALENDNPTYYDSQQRDGLSRSLSHTQQEITSHVNSILSVPIYPDSDPSRRPIGVLSIDSSGNISDTKLDEEQAQRLMMKYAGVIGDVVS